MDYEAHYNRLIARAKGRTLEGYRERHHVLPRCMGGGNEPENIVELTAEEHFVAHQLLVKIYPDKPGLAYAAMKMAKKATGRRAYGWLRKRSADAAVGNQHGKGNIGQKRAPLTATHRAKLSAAGRGLSRSEETRSRISIARTGMKRAPFSQEWRDKLSAALRGNNWNRGRTLTLSHREKLSAALRLRWSTRRKEGMKCL